MAIVEHLMSPQEHTHTAEEIRQLVEAEAHSILGVSWDKASRMVDRGDLAGTAAEAEFKMLRFLLGT